MAMKVKYARDQEIKDMADDMKLESGPIMINMFLQLETDWTDTILRCEFGFGIITLQRGHDKFNLLENLEIKQFRDLLHEKVHAREEAVMKTYTLPEEEIKNMVAEGAKLNQPQLMNGIMTYDYYFECSKIIRRYYNMHAKPTVELLKTERRKLLKLDIKEGEIGAPSTSEPTQKKITEHIKFTSNTLVRTTNIFYHHVNIS